MLAGVMLLAWLVPSLMAAHPLLMPGVELGHWSNVRLSAWLLLAAALVHPDREAWLVPLERALAGRARWVFPTALTCFAVAYKVTQHVGFATTSYDLSMYHYAVRYAWDDGPSFMWAFGLQKNFLAEHFSPVLLAFVPFDFLFRSPLVLLIGEALIFGLGAFTIAGALRSLGLRPLLAQCVAAAFATNVMCWDALTFDFHPEAMLPCGLFATLWALKEKKLGWLVVSLVGVLSIKEDVALALLPMVGVLWLDERRGWRWPLAVTAITVVWGFFALKIAMPLARPPDAPWGLFAERYGQWGATPGAALQAMLARPGEVLAALFDGPVDRQLRQLGYAPLLDPVGLLASVPTLLEQRLSSFDAQQNFAYYYGVGVAAVWLLALGRSARFVERRVGFIAGLVVASAPVLYHPSTRSMTPTSWQDVENARLLDAHIPPGADVVAQTNVVPHLPVSLKVKLFPDPATDFVALRPAIYRWPITVAQYDVAVRRLLDEEGFGVVVRTPTLVILRKGAPRDQNDAVKAMLPTSE